MATVMEPLREEHRQLWPRIEQLQTTADVVGRIPPDELRSRVEAAHAFLVGHLIPHAVAEDQTLYPLVGRVIGAAEATATMSRDHVEVGRLSEELGVLAERLAAGEPDEETLTGLRRVLYGLSALVRVHFAKEEELYVPLLEQSLTETEAAELFRAMSSAASEGKAHQHPGNEK